MRRHQTMRRISSQFDLSLYSQAYTYGDTSEDREMLALAHPRHYRCKEEVGENPLPPHVQLAAATSAARPRPFDPTLRRFSRLTTGRSYRDDRISLPPTAATTAVLETLRYVPETLYRRY